MPTDILQYGKKMIKRLIRLDHPRNRIQKLYEEKDYLEAYSQHTDLRVEADYQEAVGGHWEEIGQLQFEFLLGKSLHPHHKMLDIGCGTLRGGKHFINYLHAGHYTGMDISSKAIAYAKQCVQQGGLSEKRPHLLVSQNKDLKFREFSGSTFDYILAQSVFSHLKPEYIQECFAHIGHIMHEHSVFYCTYRHEEAYRQQGHLNFFYPFTFFESLAAQYGFKAKDCSNEYDHPRDQRIVEVMKK